MFFADTSLTFSEFEWRNQLEFQELGLSIGYRRFDFLASPHCEKTHKEDYVDLVFAVASLIFSEFAGDLTIFCFVDFLVFRV